MKHEAQHEVDFSRRNFLKFGGLLGTDPRGAQPAVARMGGNI